MSAATLPVQTAGPVDVLLLEQALRKNTWRIIPLLGLAYLVNFLDRTSVGFAALQMNKDLGLTATQFGWGAGILFFSYCVLEVPSNIAMYHVGARRWLARIMVTWGIAAAATALAVGPWSFYVLRFALGMFEAGLFPGVIWYLSIWYPGKYRTNALALFIAAAPLSQLVGGPISVSLLQMGGVLGLAGWQWMFIMEGLPAILLGIACLWLLADTPAQATWLTAAERQAVVDALAADTQENPKKDLGAAMRDPRVLTSALIVFCYTAGSYGISLWLPLILKGHDLSNTAIGWLTTIPYLFATASTFLFAWFVRRTGLKIYTLLVTLLLGIAGMMLSVFFPSLTSALIWITVGLVGVISARTIFYTVPQHFLAAAAAAGGLAFINALGAFGGFVGPVMVGWLKDYTGGYNAGMVGMTALLVVAVVATLALKRMVRTA
jgi:ACS family tartrate transporter-like MFS transporter